MFIYLDASLAAEITDLSQQATLRNAFEHLATARRESLHAVSGDRALLKRLAVELSLSQSARGAFNHMASAVATEASLQRKLSRTILVVPAAQESIPVPPYQHMVEFKVSIERFSTSQFSQSSKLVCENLSDCDFYKKIAELSLGQVHKIRLPLTFDPLLGGGSTTGPQYQKQKANFKSICLAIADGDYEAPGGPCGIVARELYSIDASTPGIGEACHIIGKSVENLIPDHALASYCTKSHGNTSLHIRHSNFIKDCPEARFYCDRKKGFTLNKYYSLPEGGPVKEFWKPRLANATYRCGKLSESCTDKEVCQDPERCDCWIYEPIGTGILEHTISDVLSKSSDTRCWQFVDTELRTRYNTIADCVISWGIAFPKLSA